MITGDEAVMFFSEKEKSLFITIHKRLGRMVDLTILNTMAEPVIKMKLITGSHRIGLTSLQHQEYMVKLVAGDNVWLQKITINY